MIPALVSLKSLIKTKSYHIDYPLFRLHYQVTVAALLAFCLILTAKILFGDTIDCKSRMLGRDDFYDNLCYSQGTFTMYAVDGQDLRRAAAEYSSHSALPPASSPAAIAQSLISSAGPVQVKPVEPEADFENLGFFGRHILKPLYNALGDDEPVKVANGQTPTLANSTHGGAVINHTFVRSTFPNEALLGSNAGEYLKKQFRAIHHYIKSNEVRFSSGVQYLYSGIMIPKVNSELYSTFFWHRYYQYIPIILFLQALFFYLPHYIWKMWENGIVSSICKQLHDNRFAPNEFIDSNYHLIDYLQHCFTLNKSLVYKYYFCHILLLLNIVTQIVVINAIFNNQFVTYGIDVFHYLFIDNDIYGFRGPGGNNNDLNNPMDFVFPKVTGCTIQVLSQAGMNADTHNFLCVLPLNILHDKFFLILWCWFFVLAVVTTLQILFDTLYTTLPVVRKYLFRRRFGPYLSEESRHSSSLPELFLLDLIGSNSDKFAFAALLRKLNKKDGWNDAGSTENQSLV